MKKGEVATGATSAELNVFATRCFRDTADQDYIAARLAHRARLYPQFLWLGLQAIEKYLKGILLYNRVPATDLSHDLERALEAVDAHCRFKLRISGPTKEFLAYLNRYGRFRYFEVAWHVRGLELHLLDLAVWEIRRYCRNLDASVHAAEGSTKSALDAELRCIELSEQRPAQYFRIAGGNLERILDDREHPARPPLVWKNLRYGKKTRTRLNYRRHLQAPNSPLSMRPGIIDDVVKYVYVPKELVKAFRDEGKRRDARPNQ